MLQRRGCQQSSAALWRPAQPHGPSTESIDPLPACRGGAAFRGKLELVPEISFPLSSSPVPGLDALARSGASLGALLDSVAAPLGEGFQ